MAKKNKRVVLRRWSKDDLRLLKSMARDKKGAEKIAKRTFKPTSVERAWDHFVVKHAD